MHRPQEALGHHEPGPDRYSMKNLTFSLSLVCALSLVRGVEVVCRWTESSMLSDAVRRGCSDAAAASVPRADLVIMIINLLRWLVALVAAVGSDDSATLRLQLPY